MELIGVCLAASPLILVGIGVVIGWWFLYGKAAMEASAMKARFQQLGDLRGKSLEEIKKVVGEPSSFVAAGEDQVLYSWNTQKYYITLVFNGNICAGVQSELSV